MAASSTLSPADLAYAGAHRLAELIRERTVSVPEVVDAVLERIELHNPTINAYRVVAADEARAAARRAQARVDAGETAPLLGVPVAIKDDADLAGHLTARGTLAFDGTPPPTRHSAVTQGLVDAGAIPLGKTNVPELEIWPFTEPPAFGAVRNPWTLEHTPGGSSGGSAAAVAAGLAPLATGSDGGGSIRIPSACCGLFGLKPTRDLISIAPKTAAWHGLSVFGPIARTVVDAALFLDATAQRPPRSHGSYLEAAQTPPGRLRIAVARQFPASVPTKLGEEQAGALDSTVALLEGLGHEVVEYRFEQPTAMTNRFLIRYLRGIHDDAASVPRPERLSGKTRQMRRMGAMITPRMLRLALAAEARDAVAVNAVFDTADVLLQPIFAKQPPRIGAYEHLGALRTLWEIVRWCPNTATWNHLGQPAASVPAGFDRDGLPLAVQLAGRRDDEATLLSLAAQMEAERPWATERPGLVP